MEPTRYTVGIGLRKVGKHWCMRKVDSNMKKVVDLPLFYKTEKNTNSIGACSSIDGEFIWVYGTGGGDLFVGCIRENGVWQSNSDGDAIGLRRVETTNSIRQIGSHFAWVTESGNFCITNERHRLFHEMDNEDPDKPDIVVYQITPEYLRIQGEYILADHRDAKKIIGRFEFYSYWAGATTLNRRRMRCKGTVVEFENVWECPDGMDYIVEYPESKIEFDE